VAPVDAWLAGAGLPPLPRGAWLEIDLDALESNLATIRVLAGRGTRVAPVLKADAYGHGLEACARALQRAGAGMLCVATLDEALLVRRAGVRVPLLVLFPIPPDAVREAAEARLELVVTDADGAGELLAAWALAGTGGTRLRIHLEIETGLERGGLPADAAADTARSIADAPGVELAGVWSHLASPANASFSSAQENRLRLAVQAIEATGLPTPPVHLSATGGLFAGSGAPHDLVRPGLALYGELPDDLPLSGAASAAAAALRPVMRLVARPLRVAQVDPGTPVGYGGRWTATQPSLIATIPIGYGDGYARTTQPGAEALVRGRRVPVVGSIAMDALAIDVTAVPGVSAADEVVLLGHQGDERITASELALRRTTIAWEVLAGMAYRIPRVYHRASGPTGVRTLAGEFLPQDGTN
jgi:alanine racemase